MKYKAIIFDFDGVLFDSEKVHLQAFNKVFSTLGFTVSADEYFQKYVGLSSNKMFDIILHERGIHLSDAAVAALRKNKINAYKEIIQYSETLQGVSHVDKFIQFFATTLNCFAICSGSTREEINATLEKLEQGSLSKYFNVIVTIDDIHAGKPSPAGYLLTAKRLNLLPAECLVIEDTLTGIQAAKNAGMDVVAITTSHDKAYFKTANFVADTYCEIRVWLESCVVDC